MQKDFYNYVSAYFQNPSMKYIRTVHGFDVYGAYVPSHLFQEYKHVLCYVDAMPVPDPYIQLGNVEWSMLETCILRTRLECPDASYDASKPFPRITLVNMNNEGATTTFFCKFPFKILLHNPVENVSPYTSHGNLISALEVFHTKVIRI